MKVLALNGSSRGENGVTHKLLTAVCQGLASAGATVQTLQVGRMEIAPCQACLRCMHQTPGRCRQHDDMDRVYPLLKLADLLILATPVYTDNMTAQLKAVMDRCVCAMQPYLFTDDTGRTRHPMTWPMPADFLLVATCGFPEPETFGPLIATFRAQAANLGSRAAAELCVPGSIAFQVEPSSLGAHLALLHQAGEELADRGGVHPATLARVNRPPLTVDEYRRLAARYEQWCRQRLERTGA